jgi:DnaJ-class molecular chaperone
MISFTWNPLQESLQQAERRAIIEAAGPIFKEDKDTCYDCEGTGFSDCDTCNGTGLEILLYCSICNGDVEKGREFIHGRCITEGN